MNNNNSNNTRIIEVVQPCDGSYSTPIE